MRWSSSKDKPDDEVPPPHRVMDDLSACDTDAKGDWDLQNILLARSVDVQFILRGDF